MSVHSPDRNGRTLFRHRGTPWNLTREDVSLLTWTGLAACWWWTATRLLRKQRELARRAPDSEGLLSQSEIHLSIFKPLPGLGEGEIPPALLEATEGFLREAATTADAEVLLGVPADEASRWEQVRADWEERFSDRVCRFVETSPGSPAPEQVREMSEHARGPLWFWSEPFLSCEPGFLEGIRSEFAASPSSLLLVPLSARSSVDAPAVLEELFYNAETLPVTLLRGDLRAAEPAEAGAALFRRFEFERRHGWEGFHGISDRTFRTKMGAVRVSHHRLSFRPSATSWMQVWKRYLRLHRKARRRNPAGYFLRILTLPTIGWLSWIGLRPGHLPAYLGLLAAVGIEGFSATRLASLAGAPIPQSRTAMPILWSLSRPIAWIFSWSHVATRWSDPRIRK